MAPEAVAVETVFQPPSEPAQREVPQGKNTPTSRRPSWKPSALQNIHHVSIQHYHNVKRSLANLRGAGDADSKEGRTFKRLAKQYARKWTGANEGLFPPRPTFKVLFWSWVAAFLGIAVLALLTYNVPWYAPTDAILHEKIHTHLVFLIGSFGASAVLVFGSIDSPLAQPRNLVGGHVFSASVGIAVAEAFSAGGLGYPKDGNKLIWVQAGLAVATAIVLMQVTRTVHPPGGATALIAVTSPPAVRLKGFYIVMPVLSGSLILLLVALIVNNFRRHYPLYWWSPDVIDVPMEDLTHHTGSGEAFMPHSESLVGVSLHGSRRGGPSLHGSVRGDSTHHSRVSYIDLSTDAGGGSAHGRRPRGEMYAPVRHHIIQFPMHVLQAEGALGGGLEPDVVMDHPTVLPVGELKASEKGEKASGKKLVLPDGDRGAIPPMERVEGWVENDARGPFERRQSSVRQEWMEQEGSVRGGEAGRPSETRDSVADEVLATTPAENEGQVHGANSILATAIGSRPSAEIEGEP